MKFIGKYQVIEEVGGSAIGKTYRVRDAFRNRELAAKILQTVPGLSTETKEQFCAHLAACAELTHRHIAKVHDLGEVDDGIFVATEWRTGMELRRFMRVNRDLSLDQKLAVIAQVAEGLGFAHSRGIAHGNLKPSNIFVDAARDVSILDFGIAKWLGALLEAGTRPEGLDANYLSPEQVLGQPFDARSDIFALGLMLYEFASGKYPFSADPGLNPREIVHSDPEPLRKLDPLVPEDLEQLVARALAKDPDKRLQAAEEFASGLYLAAQQIRRLASVSVDKDAAAVEQPVAEPIVNQLPPALTPAPEPVVAKPALPMDLSTPTLRPRLDLVAAQEGAAPQTPAAAPKVRERPQDAEPAPQPWSARSYAAGASRPPAGSTSNAKPPVAAVPAYQAPAAPEFQPPKSFLRPATPPPDPTLPMPAASKPNKLTQRALIAAVGLILAAGFVGSLISRQNLRASQNKNHAAIVRQVPAAPVAKPSRPAVTPVVAEPKTPKAGESGPDDIGNPEFSARQTLNGPVRSYWESGKYAQALALVNQVLASDATNEEARSWKKKIREAQAAEAALK